jgi:hypothetical protein
MKVTADDQAGWSGLAKKVRRCSVDDSNPDVRSEPESQAKKNDIRRCRLSGSVSA